MAFITPGDTSPAPIAVLIRDMLQFNSSGIRSSLVWEPGFEAIRKIEHDGRTFLLRASVPVIVALDSDLWSYESKGFGILAFGGTRDAAWRSFSEDFAVRYDHVARETDENLTPDAMQVKQAFNKTVESVTEHS